MVYKHIRWLQITVYVILRMKKEQSAQALPCHVSQGYLLLASSLLYQVL
jgi:hypothetical protein